MGNVLPWRLRQVYLQVNAGLVPSDIWRLQLLDQDDDDPDEEHKVNLTGTEDKRFSVAREWRSKVCTPLICFMLSFI